MTVILKVVRVEAPWLSGWLRSERQSAGLTQTELAARAGVSRGLICSVERGTARTVKNETLQKIAVTLGASLDAGGV